MAEREKTDHWMDTEGKGQKGLRGEGKNYRRGKQSLDITTERTGSGKITERTETGRITERTKSEKVTERTESIEDQRKIKSGTITEETVSGKIPR